MAGSIQDETAGLLSSLTSDAQLRLYYASDSDSDDDLAEQDDDMVMDGILLCEKGHVPEPSDDKAMAARRQSVDSLGAPRRGSASASSATISTPAIITHSTPAKSKQSLSTATTTTTTTTAPNNRRFSDARPQVMGPASTTSKKIISLPSILTTSLQRYETILSTLPSSPPHPIAPSEKHSRKPSRNFTGCAAPMNNDDISYDELQPLSETWQPQRSGHLWIQKRDDKWNYAWCSHMGMRFRYQDTPTSTSWHEYTILYVAYHPIENRRRENAVILQPEQTWFYFQLYTPEQIYQCRAASDADAIAWMTSISRVIRVMYNDNEWAEKNRAAARWHSMMMKCYEYELRRYTKMLYRIAHAGLIDARFQQNGNNDTVFAGHLCLSERTDSTWTDYYMLLCDTTLLYFQSSKEREPTGVIVLRYATVTLEESPLRRGECIICIKTPLKRFYLKLKHSVVAAEWLFSFERVMRPNDVQFGSAQAVLDRINAVQNDLSHLSACIQHPDGLTAFRSFVTDPIHQNQLRFWRDLERYLTYRLPEKERKTLGDSISLRITQSLERLKSSQSPDSPSSSSLSLPFDLDPSFIQTLQDTKQLQDVVTKTMQQLSQLQSRIVTSLEKLYFTDFKQSPGYKTLQISIQQSSSTPPTTAPDSPPTIDPSDLERDNTDSTNGKRSISKSSSPSSQHTSSHAIPSDPSFNPDTTKLVVKWLRKACGTQAEKWKTQTYYLWPDQTHVLIGRASSNHIVIHDTGLSRSHGRIEWDQNGMLYIDLGSSFGTKREGVALMKGRVYVGETLHMGKYCTLKIDRCDANDMKAKKRKQQKCSIM